MASSATWDSETGVIPAGTSERGSGLLFKSAVLRTEGGSTPEYSRRKTGVRPATAISAARDIEPTVQKVSFPWHWHNADDPKADSQKHKDAMAAHFRQSGRFNGSNDFISTQDIINVPV